MSDPAATTVGMHANSPTPRPTRVSNRRDAVQLWMHLLDLGVVFHWEEDPAEWVDGAGHRVLADRDVATMRRLIAEVDRLGAEAFDCYADAEALRQLALLGSLYTLPVSTRGVVASLQAAA